MDLESIPGVGAKTADALAELEDPERAIREGDVAAIARAPGISEGRAARIARAAIRDRHEDPGGFLATDRARELYEDAIGLVQAHAVTDHAARRLETIFPSSAPSRIAEVRERVAAAVSDVDPDPDVAEALRDVGPLEEPGSRAVRVRDRCLATSDAEVYAEAEERIPELSVEIVEHRRQLGELARGYSTVIALDEAFAGVDVEGDVRVEPDALEHPERVVPERTLAFFARNRERLRAAAAVHERAGLEAPCDTAALLDALEDVDEDGEVVGDEELQRLETAVNDLDAAVSTAESVANDHLREVIAEEEVAIDGTDLLSLVEQGAGVASLLERELADEFDAAIEKARDHLVDALQLRDTETIARRAFPDDPTFPVEHREDPVARLREELTAARDRKAAELKREVASDLAAFRDDARALVDRAIEHDVDRAIAAFADACDCAMPAVGGVEDGLADDPPTAPDGTGAGDGEPGSETPAFAIAGGRSPLLDVPHEDVAPVDYGVAGVSLLSGVNSGGKTSTLDLVGLVTVLAHAGLPVPAEGARIDRVAALHYHAKTQGTLDAGAFESTLQAFGEVVAAAERDADAAASDGDGTSDEHDARTGGDGEHPRGDGRPGDGGETPAADGGATASADGTSAGATAAGGATAASGAHTMVLVDELESITEPGAAATIMAGILESLAERDALAVFVSHLAGDVIDAADADLDVDGIRAEGLEDGELVVDRSPEKGVLARSTPELIVEKLADDEGGFYERLLGKFGDE